MASRLQLPGDDSVLLRVTHSNLKTFSADVRFSLESTVEAVKDKLWKKCGTAVDSMRLELYDDTGAKVSDVNDNARPFGFYSPLDGYRLHIVDLDPSSVTSGGWLEDTSLVEKYKISDEAYDKLDGTYRKFKEKLGPRITAQGSKMVDDYMEDICANIKLSATTDVTEGLFDRMQLSATTDVTEEVEFPPHEACPFLDTTAEFVVQPGERLPASFSGHRSTDNRRPPAKRQNAASRGAKVVMGLSAASGGTAAAAAAAGAGAVVSVATRFGAPAGGSFSGSVGKSHAATSAGTSSGDSDIDPSEKFAPYWDLTNGSLFDDPESCKDFMFNARTPAEFYRGGGLKNRDLSDAGCSSMVNSLFSFVEIHNRWADGVRENRDLRRKTTRLEDDNASLKLRCDFLEKEKEKVTLSLSETQEDLCVQSAAVKRLSSDLRSVKSASEDQISQLQGENARLQAERNWLVSDGMGLAFNKVRDSDEFLNMLARINSLSDKVGYNAGLRDGARLAAAGKRPEDAPKYNKDALEELRQLSKEFDEASFPMSGSIAALASSDLDAIKAFLASS